MTIDGSRGWTAQIVISFDHAGLRPYGRMLENEIRHVLARLDDPKAVRSYLTVLKRASEDMSDTFGIKRVSR